MDEAVSAISRLFYRLLGNAEQHHESRWPDSTGGITTLGLQCQGKEKGYCTHFQIDGSVLYVGDGTGLKGERVGALEEDDRWHLLTLMQLLHQTDLDSLADRYSTAILGIWERPIPRVFSLPGY